MALEAGTTLGPYEIQAPIGAGGMGEVYKARDTRLDRSVAIKVLPEHVAADPDLKQRFEREARAAAALNHPHICTLHDVGQHEGTDFLVMEYLEGETLGQRLEKGALPLDQALTIATDIADALDKAHRQGITHRDLKPGNIMLTKAGAKLLDFGLAKLRPAGAPGVEGVTAVTTASEPLTGQGTILGTLQYMAPEQLEGKEADHRTDLFAFGAIVYEMVTGQRAFQGDSQASLIGAILKDDPPALTHLQPVSPPALARVVSKCLAKDPDARWYSAHDLHDELQWVRTERASPGSPAASRDAGPGWVVAAAVTVVAGLALLVVLGRSWSDEPPPRQVSIPIHLPAGVALEPESFTVSPDGHVIVYAGREDGEVRLYRRDLEALDAEVIPGTAAARRPAFSPDGRSVAFSDGDRPGDEPLRIVPLAGGQATTIVDGTRPESMSWATDDSIVFSLTGVGTTLQRASLVDGSVDEITQRLTAAGENDHRWPDLLPGGRSLLYEVNYASGRPSDIVVQSIDGNDRQVLIEGSQPRYVQTGHIVFRRGSVLWAVRFDADSLTVAGTPMPVAEDVASFAVSASGTLVYAPRQPTALRGVVWVDDAGVEEPVGLEPGDYDAPAIAPDGGQLAMRARVDGNVDIWIYDLERGQGRRATFDPGVDNYPLWTPDGQRFAFSSARGGGIRNLFWRPADGTGQVERLTDSDSIQSPWTWSRDGETLVFQQQDGDTDWNVYARMMDTGSVDPLVQTPGIDGQPQVSTDGRWIAYTSDSAIWVRPFPGLDDGAWQIADAADSPRWAPDGRALYYRQRSPERMMRVSVTPRSPAEWGAPEPLFEFDYHWGLGVPSYDVSPTDGRFLMLKDDDIATDRSSLPDLVVVMHWADELERLVPGP